MKTLFCLSVSLFLVQCTRLGLRSQGSRQNTFMPSADLSLEQQEQQTTLGKKSATTESRLEI